LLQATATIDFTLDSKYVGLRHRHFEAGCAFLEGTKGFLQVVCCEERLFSDVLVRTNRLYV